MAEIAELLALVAEGDEDAIAEVTKLFASKDSAAVKDKAVMARELKIKTDAELRGKYPRAIRAYDADDLTLPDDLSDSALEKALAAKEAKLEALGVPAAATPTAPDGEPVTDPAQAWATNRGPSGPGHQTPESAEPKLREHLEAGASVAEIVKDIHALHREGHGRGLDPTGRGAFHASITQDYESEPHPNSIP